MLEIKILVSDVDYNDVVDVLLPKLASKWEKKDGIASIAAGQKDRLADLAHGYMKLRGPDKTEEMVVDMIGKKKEMLKESANRYAKKKGVKLNVADLEVKKV